MSQNYFFKTAAAFCLFALFLQANVFQFSGNSKQTVDAYIAENMSFRTNAPEEIFIAVPEENQTFFLYQKISGFRVKYNTRNLSRKEIRDPYGNKTIAVRFKPVARGGRLNTISYELKFRAVLDFFVSEAWTAETYRSVEDDLGDYEKLFLSNASGVAVGHSVIVSQLKKLVNRNEKLPLSVQKIFFWINKNIRHIRIDKAETAALLAGRPTNSRQHSAVSVLQNRAGSLVGKMNLFASFLRTAGIPVRFVRGYSFPWQAQTAGSNSLTLSMASDKDDYYWMEVYLPEFKWLSVDLTRSVLMTLPNLIKVRHAPSFAELLQTKMVGRKVRSDKIFQLRSKIKPSYKFDLNWPVLSKMIFASPVNSSDLDLVFKEISEVRDFSTAAVGADINSMPVHDFQISSAKPALAQLYSTEKEIELNQIMLHLWLLWGDSKRVWLTLHKDNGGSVGEEVAKSRSRRASSFRKYGVFHEYGFKFQKTTLAPGRYWIVFRSASRSPVSWGLVPNSYYGSWFDSVQLNKDLSVRSVIQGDFIFYVK